MFSVSLICSLVICSEEAIFVAHICCATSSHNLQGGLIVAGLWILDDALVCVKMPLVEIVDACAYSLVLITLVEVGILSPCLCCIVVEGDVVYVWVLVRGACVCVHTHEVSHTWVCVYGDAS